MTDGGRGGLTASPVREAGRVLAAVVMVVAAAAVLAIWLDRAVAVHQRLAGPALDRQYRQNLAQFRCLSAQVRREVPRDAPVFIGGGYDGQVLSELIVRWASPAPERRAAWQLSLERTGPCAGERVEAARA